MSDLKNAESRSLAPRRESLYVHRLEEIANDLLQLDQPYKLHEAKVPTFKVMPCCRLEEDSVIKKEYLKQ